MLTRHLDRQMNKQGENYITPLFTGGIEKVKTAIFKYKWKQLTVQYLWAKFSDWTCWRQWFCIPTIYWPGNLWVCYTQNNMSEQFCSPLFCCLVKICITASESKTSVSGVLTGLLYLGKFVILYTRLKLQNNRIVFIWLKVEQFGILSLTFNYEMFNIT